MNDPHVECLFYSIGTGTENISYNNPEPLSFSDSIGNFRLEDGKLTVEMAADFVDDADARQLVEPFLRSWEIETDLKANLGQIRFKFENSKIVDRNPAPPGDARVRKISCEGTTSAAGKLSMHLKCATYRNPPTIFRTTQDVEIKQNRWARYREGKEPLHSMVYFVLTSIENDYGGRRKAAEKLKIDFAVLQKIGELSSTKGDADTARKAEYVEMTNQEGQWLEPAVRRVIRRCGEIASGGPLEQLTMRNVLTFNQ